MVGVREMGFIVDQGLNKKHLGSCYDVFGLIPEYQAIQTANKDEFYVNGTDRLLQGPSVNTSSPLQKQQYVLTVWHILIVAKIFRHE